MSPIACARPCGPAIPMTIDLARRPAGATLWRRLQTGHALPVTTVVLLILALWYLGAIALNAPRVLDQWKLSGAATGGIGDLIAATWSMERPVLPTPTQIGIELFKTVIAEPITSNRSLLYHAYVTASSTVVGFALGALLGVLLAVGIVHVRTLDRSLMPWIIASQTVLILAIAPVGMP